MEDIQRASAIWILKIRECIKLTQVITLCVWVHCARVCVVLLVQYMYAQLYQGISLSELQLRTLRVSFGCLGCLGCLVPDILHDVLEGALQYEVKLLLKHCILTDKYFNLDHLNQLVDTFELGYMKTDRPSQIT